VTDPSGAVVPGAANVIKSGDESVRSTSTDEGGQYRIERLPLGTYSIRVEKSGFESFETAGIAITAGTVKRFDVKLALRKERKR
jgi:hypothetical protein